MPFIKRVSSASFALYFIALFAAILTRSILETATLRADAGWVAAVAVPWGLLIHRAHRPPPWWSVVLAAFTLRAVLVGTPPLLSDDLYRYLWEGVAGLSNHNPYVHSPEGSRGVADALRVHVNHGYATSIYPPGAHLWFQAVASIDPRPRFIQCATAAIDVLNVALLLTICRQRGLSRFPAWVYAIHPLPILAAACGAHVDVLCICLTLCACAAAPGAARITLVTVAAWVKVLPVLLLGTLWRSSKPRSVLFWSLTTSALLLLTTDLLQDAGLQSLASMDLYAKHWSFNGLVYPWLLPWLGGLTRPLLWAIAALMVLWTLRTQSDIVAVLAIVSLTMVTLSPTVHPWYALWLFASGSVLWGTRVTLPLTFLLGGYAVLFSLYDGSWAEPWWLWWATWPPALASAAWLHARSTPTRGPT